MATNVDRRGVARGSCRACDCTEFEVTQDTHNCAYCGHLATEHVRLDAPNDEPLISGLGPNAWTPTSGGGSFGSLSSWSAPIFSGGSPSSSISGSSMFTGTPSSQQQQQQPRMSPHAVPFQISRSPTISPSTTPPHHDLAVLSLSSSSLSTASAAPPAAIAAVTVKPIVQQQQAPPQQRSWSALVAPSAASSSAAATSTSTTSQQLSTPAIKRTGTRCRLLCVDRQRFFQAAQYHFSSSTEPLTASVHFDARTRIVMDRLFESMLDQVDDLEQEHLTRSNLLCSNLETESFVWTCCPAQINITYLSRYPSVYHSQSDESHLCQLLDRLAQSSSSSYSNDEEDAFLSQLALFDHITVVACLTPTSEVIQSLQRLHAKQRFCVILPMWKHHLEGPPPLPTRLLGSTTSPPSSTRSRSVHDLTQSMHLLDLDALSDQNQLLTTLWTYMPLNSRNPFSPDSAFVVRGVKSLHSSRSDLIHHALNRSGVPTMYFWFCCQHDYGYPGDSLSLSMLSSFPPPSYLLFRLYSCSTCLSVQ